MPQLDTPRTTPFCSRTILPAVLAILIVTYQYGGLNIHLRSEVVVHTLSLLRGGRAVPTAVSPPSFLATTSQRYTHHSDHFVQHLDLLAGVAVAVAIPLAKSGRFRKTFAQLP